MPFTTKKLVVGSLAFAAIVGIAGFFTYGLLPADASASTQVVFEVKQGEGSRAIVGDLARTGLVRSSLVTETLALLTGSAFHLQPGLYKLDAAMSPRDILDELASKDGGEVTVTIPEGSNLYQIDGILANALVIHRGDLINFVASGATGSAASGTGAADLEGKLFPDTYRFYTDANVASVVQEMEDAFASKAAPLLAADSANATSDLIMASVVEKEVSDPGDQAIVAGILWKRISAGMPLQADATVCYAMQRAAPLSASPCGTLDLKINSPYNTYLYKGLPPGPIGNPGISAIQAAIHPVRSPYWFYLSDPKTGKTIFSKTLDEQHQNTVKYLEGD